MAVAAITRADVQRWFDSLSGTPGVANRALPVLSVMPAAEQVAGRIAKAMGFKAETLSGESDNAQMRPHPPTLPRLPHWVIYRQMQTVAETPIFARQADKLFTDEERRALIEHLAGNPLAGEEIPGTGGVRKLRFVASGRGKRGGARVIYFYGGEDILIYALLAYVKSARTDLNPAQRRAVAGIVTAIKETRKEKP